MRVVQAPSPNACIAIELITLSGEATESMLSATCDAAWATESTTPPMLEMKICSS